MPGRSPDTSLNKELKVTLTGTLGFVPIDEILRLLTRSNQEGAVEVTADGFHGRVFVGHGGVDLATTSDDDVLVRHLVNSGLAEEEMLRRVTSRETTLAALTESNQRMIELLREITVESIFQISDRGGAFEVREGETTPFASPKTFDLEKLLTDARERSKEWARVNEVIHDLGGPISLRRDLGERPEVSVNNDDWKVLSEVQNGRSVEEIADHLGTTEFWTARVVARLVASDLVEIGSPAPTTSPYTSEPEPHVGRYRETEEMSEEAAQVVGYDEPRRSEPVHEETRGEDPGYQPSYDDMTGYEDHVDPEPVAAEDSYDESDQSSEEDPHDESWWREPENELGHVEEEPSVAMEVEDQSEIPPIAPLEEPEDVEEDTEAFLEKVFSELESDKSETEEGHGLLRRRRMGSLRDFSSDS